MATTEKEPAATIAPCSELLGDDLGWGVGTIFRAYVAALNDIFIDVPGGSRGFQILLAASRGHVSSQLALAQHLGVDRTVMTYLLDDLESSSLIERRPDPADRRARRIIATPLGNQRLELLTSRRDEVEGRLLAPLEASERTSFRAMVQLLATRIEASNLPLAPCGESPA